MSIANLWQLYNLTESPFFQQTLRAGTTRSYPVSLFVGRERDARRLLQTIVSSPRTSRQVVHAPVGYGKTTLVDPSLAIGRHDSSVESRTSRTFSR